MANPQPRRLPETVDMPRRRLIVYLWSFGRKKRKTPLRTPLSLIFGTSMILSGSSWCFDSSEGIDPLGASENP
jgi:hypothetical protein